MKFIRLLHANATFRRGFRYLHILSVFSCGVSRRRRSAAARSHAICVSCSVHTFKHSYAENSWLNYVFHTRSAFRSGRALWKSKQQQQQQWHIQLMPAINFNCTHLRNKTAKTQTLRMRRCRRRRLLHARGICAHSNTNKHMLT